MPLSKTQYDHILMALCNIEITLEEMQSQMKLLMHPDTTQSEVNTEITPTASISERPNVKFMRLWKANSEFRNNIMEKFSTVKMAVENDAAAKGETYEFKKIAKQASCAWKLCKADKKNNSNLVQYVADEMKRLSSNVKSSETINKVSEVIAEKI